MGLVHVETTQKIFPNTYQGSKEDVYKHPLTNFLNHIHCSDKYMSILAHLEEYVGNSI